MEHLQCLSSMYPLVGAAASAGLGGLALAVAAVKRKPLAWWLARHISPAIALAAPRVPSAG